MGIVTGICTGSGDAGRSDNGGQLDSGLSRPRSPPVLRSSLCREWPGRRIKLERECRATTQSASLPTVTLLHLIAQHQSMSSLTQTDYFSFPSPPTRSLSSSSASSTSFFYSRSSEDIFDRLVTRTAYTAVHLWSGGNLRLDGHDLTLAADEILKLMEIMGQDARFKLIDCVMFDAEGEDWKMSYSRTTIATPSGSAAGSECGSDV